MGQRFDHDAYKESNAWPATRKHDMADQGRNVEYHQNYATEPQETAPMQPCGASDHSIKSGSSAFHENCPIENNNPCSSAQSMHSCYSSHNHKTGKEAVLY